MSTIADRTTRVMLMLGNRSDLVTSPTPAAGDRIVGWVQDAYTEIAMGYPFEELEDSIPDQFVTSIDTYNYPTAVRAVKTLTGVKSDGTTWPIWKRDIRVIDRYSSTTNVGPPSIYAPFKKQIIVRPVPDTVYDFIWRVWLKPSFADDIVSTELLVPDDWLEIIDYAAALRGHTELLERDKAAEINRLLFGGFNPGTGKPMPGLIRQKMLLFTAESVAAEYPIQPRVRRYTNTL